MTSWPTVAFGEAIDDVTGGNVKIQASAYEAVGALRIVDQGAAPTAGYTSDPGAAFKGALPVLAFGDHTKVLKFLDRPFALGADGVKVLRTRSTLDARFAYHYLRTVELPVVGYSRHFKFLKEIRIPLPPLEEQRRIAAILDQADTLLAQRRSTLTLMDDLAASTLFDAIGNPHLNSRGFRREPLGDIAKVTTGNTPSRADAANYGPGLEWLKSDNLGAFIHPTTARESLTVAGARSARVVGPGAVLMTCIAGSPASIGRCSLTNRRVAFNQQINAIESAAFHPRFLLALMREMKSEIEELSTGGMKGLVSKSRLQALVVPVPDLTFQARLGEALAAVDLQRNLGMRQYIQLDSLRGALTAAAFFGSDLQRGEHV